MIRFTPEVPQRTSEYLVADAYLLLWRIVERVEPTHRRHIQHAVRRRRRAADGLPKIHLTQDLLLLAGGEGEEGTVAHAEVHLAVRDETRSPDLSFAFMRPKRFTRRRI